jgi:hypothetical protein
VFTITRQGYGSRVAFTTGMWSARLGGTRGRRSASPETVRGPTETPASCRSVAGVSFANSGFVARTRSGVFGQAMSRHASRTLRRDLSPELSSEATNKRGVPTGNALLLVTFPAKVASLPLIVAVRRQVSFPLANSPPSYNVKVPLALSVAGLLSSMTLNENDFDPTVPLPLANSAAFFFFAAVVSFEALVFFCASATLGIIITKSTATDAYPPASQKE